jgi:hypothetical protein
MPMRTRRQSRTLWRSFKMSSGGLYKG